MIALALLALLASQSAPARDAKAAAATGTATISGKVLDAETGEPIGGAVLMIGQLKIGVRQSRFEADERGVFTATGLPAGDYIVAASPPEHHEMYLTALLNTDMTAVMGFQRKPSLTLKEGEHRADLVIKLGRAFAIDGRVVDELGEPMADMQISVEPLDATSFGSGRGAGGQYTDDRGVFRAYGLSPGAYRVCASPSGMGYSVPRPSSSDAVDRRYVKTCYPSAPDGGGERVTVTPRGAPALTIVMQRVTGYTISGQARSESGASNVRVSITQGTGYSNTSVDVDTQPDGRFTARGVPPGDYVITARTYDKRGSFGDVRTTEMARVPIRLEASDVTGLDVVATKGATLVGRIVSDGALPAGTKLLVRPAPTMFPMVVMDGPLQATVRPDLTFELTGVHDPLILSVQGLPAGWVITSVRYRGSEIVETATKMATTTEPDELQIVVSPKSAVLSARAVNASGQVVRDAMVFMVAATGDRVIQPRNVGLLQATSAEAFEMPPARAGEYLVIAVPMIEMMQLMRGPEAVTRMRQLGTPVTLRAGEKYTIDVVVRSLSEVK